jgi:hypothetical protein
MIFSALVPSQVAAAAAFLLVVFGARIILRNAPLAVLVTLPMAAIIPWNVPGGDEMAAFSLAAAGVWVAWLYGVRSPHVRNRTAVLAGVCVSAALISAQSLLVVAAAGAYFFVRGRESRKLAGVMIALPIVAVALVALPGDPQALNPANWPDLIRSAFTGGWAARNWYGALLGRNFTLMHSLYNPAWVWPLILPLVILICTSRREWWFSLTALWSGVLLVGTLALGRETDALYSLPLQIALIVPASVAGFHTVLKPLRANRALSAGR